MLVLEIVTAVFLLLNKLLLIFDKKATAWLCGIVGMGALSFLLYFQQTHFAHPKNLLIMIISNSSGVPIMLYGFFIVIIKKSIKLKEILERWRIIFTFSIVLFTVALCISFFVKFLNAYLVMEQFLLSLFATIGTLLLCFDRRKMSLWGWLFLIPTHILSADIMFRVSLPIVAVGQVLSILTAIYGFVQTLQKPKGK